MGAVPIDTTTDTTPDTVDKVVGEETGWGKQKAKRVRLVYPWEVWGAWEVWEVREAWEICHEAMKPSVVAVAVTVTVTVTVTLVVVIMVKGKVWDFTQITLRSM